MTAKPRPETTTDLEAYFCEILNMKPNQVESYFEFLDWPEAIGARFKKYLPHGFKDLAGAVQSWGGQYDRDRRQFVVSKPTKDVGKAEASQPDKTTEISPGKEVPRFTFLPTDSILSMPFQSRVSIGDPEIAELAGSMQSHGILGPLLVRRKSSGRYELVAGHRRLKAAKKAGMFVISIQDEFTKFQDHSMADLQLQKISDLINLKLGE